MAALTLLNCSTFQDESSIAAIAPANASTADVLALAPFSAVAAEKQAVVVADVPNDQFSPIVA